MTTAPDHAAIKVGVLPNFDGTTGGVYQYCQMVLAALDGLRDRLEPIVVYGKTFQNEAKALESLGWKALSITSPTARTRVRQALANTLGESVAAGIADLLRRRGQPAMPIDNDPSTIDRARQRWLLRNGLDLMLYPAPTTAAFESGVPYVMAVHDLQHRLHPEFPEVSANGELESREYLYTNGIRGAEAIVVDSDVGREDLLELYGHLTAPERVWVLPYVLPPTLVVHGRGPSGAVLNAGVVGPYLLFPAQFWAHKNHVRVAHAVAALHRDGVDVTVVMTGSADDEPRRAILNEVREVASRHGLQDLLRILGYVDDETIADLYRGATGVILPTFFGPTNIPVIEAWAMGVPVLTSDIRGIREQCGDAAVLVDPTSVDSIADGLRRLWTDPALRSRLAEAGRARLRLNDPSMFRDRLGEVLLQASSSAKRRASEVAA